LSIRASVARQQERRPLAGDPAIARGMTALCIRSRDAVGLGGEQAAEDERARQLTLE
jgi:hypothetical protein